MLHGPDRSIHLFLQASIGGVCNTTYIIQENKEADNIYVTKLIDLNDCDFRVKKIIGATYASPCKVCKEVRKMDLEIQIW